jgi:transposase
MENQQFPLHDNAPAHRSVLVKYISAKNNVTTLAYTPYSPDLAQADIYLFPELKSALKGRCFCDVTDIIKNAMEELKRLSKWLPRTFSTLI